MQKVTYKMLEAEALRQMESLESDKNEVHDLMQQVQECTKKLEVDRVREQVERHKCEQDLALRMKKNEEEKKSQREEFHEREQEIRARLEEYKQALLRERQQKILEADAVRNGIHETIKRHEAKLAEDRQLESLEEMKLEAELRAEMESKLFDLEQKRQMEEKEMQDRQQEELKELKRVNLKETEDLLQQTIRQQEAVMKEMEDAVRETQALNRKLQNEDYARECVICLDEFGDDPSRQRAHYRDCNHANICYSCAMDLWKQKNKKCPYCNTPAKVKPGRLPAKIFF